MIKNVLQKSTLISGVSEKQRAKFFNQLLKKVAEHKKSIELIWFFCTKKILFQDWIK